MSKNEAGLRAALQDISKSLIAPLLRAKAQKALEQYSDHEPGEVVATGECPACGAKLVAEYGDDEGEIEVLTTGESIVPVRTSVWSEHAAHSPDPAGVLAEHGKPCGSKE